jgi:hypothetical protein
MIVRSSGEKPSGLPQQKAATLTGPPDVFNGMNSSSVSLRSRSAARAGANQQRLLGLDDPPNRTVAESGGQLDPVRAIMDLDRFTRRPGQGAAENFRMKRPQMQHQTIDRKARRSQALAKARDQLRRTAVVARIARQPFDDPQNS